MRSAAELDAKFPRPQGPCTPRPLRKDARKHAELVCVSLSLVEARIRQFDERRCRRSPSSNAAASSVCSSTSRRARSPLPLHDPSLDPTLSLSLSTHAGQGTLPLRRPLRRARRGRGRRHARTRRLRRRRALRGSSLRGVPFAAARVSCSREFDRRTAGSSRKSLSKASERSACVEGESSMIDQSRGHQKVFVGKRRTTQLRAFVRRLAPSQEFRDIYCEYVYSLGVAMIFSLAGRRGPRAARVGEGRGVDRRPPQRPTTGRDSRFVLNEVSRPFPVRFGRWRVFWKSHGPRANLLSSRSYSPDTRLRRHTLKIQRIPKSRPVVGGRSTSRALSARRRATRPWPSRTS